MKKHPILIPLIAGILLAVAALPVSASATDDSTPIIGKFFFWGGDIPLANPDMTLLKGPLEFPCKLGYLISWRKYNYKNNACSVEAYFNGVKVGSCDAVDGTFRTRTISTPLTQSFLTFPIKDSEVKWGAGADNTVQIKLTDRSGGVLSISPVLHVYGYSFPEWLKTLVISPVFDGVEYSFAVTFPPKGVKLTKKLPIIGEFGPEISLAGTFGATIPVSDFYVDVNGGISWACSDKKEGYFGVGGTGEGTFFDGGRNFSPKFTALSFYVEKKDKFILVQLSPFTALPPGTETTIGNIPLAGPRLVDLVKVFKIELAASPSLKGTLDFVLNDRDVMEVKKFTLNGGLDLRATAGAVIDLDIIGRFGFEGFVGGAGTLSMEIAANTTPSNFFKELNVKCYMGATLYGGPFQNDFKYTFLEIKQGAPRSGLPSPVDPQYIFRNTTNPWTIIPRSDTPLRFPMAELRRVRGGGGSGDNSAEAAQLAAFDELTKNAPTPAPRSSITATPALTSAIVSIAKGVSPISHPAMAASGNNLMVLFAKDTRIQGSSATQEQFTQLLWTRFDGTNWSIPAAMPPGNGGAQLEPSLCCDGSGRTIAAWQQMRDPAFNAQDLGLYLDQNDTVVSVFDPSAATWSQPLVLDDELGSGALAPMVRGPMGNGNVMVLWQSVKFPSSNQTGTGPGAARAEFKYAIWNARESRWLPGKTLMNMPADATSYDFGAGGDRAILAWVTREGTSDRRSLKIRVFHADRGWEDSPRTPRGINPLPDTVVPVSIGPDGKICYAWSQRQKYDQNFQNHREGEYVSIRVWNSNQFDVSAPTEVYQNPPGDNTPASDLHFLRLPGGRVALTWTDQTANGTGIATLLYDPATLTWGRADLLPGRWSKAVCLFGAAGDPEGNIIPLWMDTDILSKSVAAPNQDNVLTRVDNAPIPGSRTINVGKFRPFADMVFTKGGLSARVVMRPGIGKSIEVEADATNIGALGIDGRDSGQMIHFYDGDPASGGKEFGSMDAYNAKPVEEEESVYDAKYNAMGFAGGKTRRFSATLTLPPPPGGERLDHTGRITDARSFAPDAVDTASGIDRKIYAVIGRNPVGDTPDKIRKVSLDGPHFRVIHPEGTVAPDGSASIRAVVLNEGTRSDTPFDVDLCDANGARIATTQVLNVPCGGSWPVDFTLPSGSVKGSSSYRLKLDAKGVLPEATRPVVDAQVSVTAS